MPHNRAPKLGAKWYLPRNEYRYVVAFCLTYKDLRQKLQDLNGWHSHDMDGMPRGSGTGDPTQREALERVKIQTKLDIIESCVRECAGEKLYRPMLIAVTRDDMPLWRLKMDFEFEMGSRQFSNLRRKIYYKISKEL